MKSTSIPGEGFVKAFAPDGHLRYEPNWLAASCADGLVAVLETEIEWQARSIEMFGKAILQPRLLCFQGDHGVRYRYSGATFNADPWHPAVAELCRRLNAQTGQRFNSVLLNRYRDGRDSMGWHADDEPELGRNPTIVSISVGARRRFVLRRRKCPAERFELAPEHGSLMIMSGDLQHNWQHQVPKTARPVGERFNLTFRTIRADRQA
ncbi:MAG: alpha-ketoglutarate-dependent dioxygenase AlkB [Wenzhouxiangellaceae bacterium]|nr:alpha-ketoglutarate-dependent dioxygenase AlkB [Wenzhouxiangellaceae bacterium]